MKDWKNIIFRNWNLMRLIRLGLSVFIIVEAVNNYDVLFGVIGSVLLLQSVFNVGCCSNGACYTGRPDVDDIDVSKEVIFEEIKSK